MDQVIFLLVAVFFCGANGGSYLITAPSSIQRGSPYDITVDILNATGVQIEAQLQSQVYNGSTGRYDVFSLQSLTETFSKGKTGTISLPIAPDLECSSCQVKLRARGGLQFERSISTQVRGTTVVILIQTDKAIYKPQQTVRFRALAVYPDLQLYTGNFNVEIQDPRNNKIKVMKGLRSTSGVVEGSLDLSDQPLFGDWNILVRLEDTTDIQSQVFTVAQYELPRFEVTVELPPFGLISDTLLTGKVKAKYTFGQPVSGMVELHVGPNTGPDRCGEPPKTTQIAFEIDGEKSFSIPKDDIERAVRLYDSTEIRVTAFVTETATGVRLNGSSTIKFHTNKYRVKFLDNTPSVFKPGLPYTAYIQVTTPDGMPPTAGNHVVSVYTSVTYELTVDDQLLYDKRKFTGNYPLPGQNVTLPANGVLPIQIDIPNNATSINVKATFDKVKDSKSIEKTYSASNNYIQLSLLDSNVQAKSTISIRVEGTEPISHLTYKVLSRGVVVAVSMVDGSKQQSFTFDLPVTSSMAPTAHLLAYYARDDQEIVADSLAFNVEGIFQNEVSIAFSKNESEPAKEVSVHVTADPDSQVNVLAVDQSVLLLKTGNDITAEKVNDAVAKFDKGEKPSDSNFALSYSAESVRDVFEKTGLIVITDVQMDKPYTDFAFQYGAPEADFMYGPPGPGSRSRYGPPMAMSAKSRDNILLGEELAEVERIRNVFPEAWLWTSTKIRSDGKASIETTVPDTITSWVASAFATNPITGLGVAPTTAKLRVFRPFFVSLTYPSTVTRNEQVVVQATVFNYLPNDADVTVTLKGSSSFQSVTVMDGGLETLDTGDKVVSVRVKTEGQGVAYFPILTSEIGIVDIEVTAQTSMAADGVRRQIIVQPEGAPVGYNYPIFINIDDAGKAFHKNITFPMPASVVSGSEKVRVKVTGDLLGSSLDSLTSLLELPTGCGEQSMVKFAPDLYIAQYLKATNQLSDALQRKIIEYLEAGYQRQLTYQRYDGGFSAFGNSDESGSTWLTAFVSKALHEAREYIFVDDAVLEKAVDWLVDRQSKDGSFTDFGKVLDPNMQGTQSGPALTAYVLLSLLENRELANDEACRKNEFCFRLWSWGNATANAVSNLEGLVHRDAINDQFSLAVVSYALTLANSPAAGAAFTKLRTFAKDEGGLLYWSANATISQSGASIFHSWSPPRVQARPIDILITSYAVLTYTEMGQVNEGFPAVKWLTTQRNSFGGFASSQDTTVGLQALSGFASQFLRPDTDLHVTVSAQGQNAEFTVTKDNALSLQVKELKGAPTDADVQATGKGFALVEMDYRFHVNDDLSTPSFDVSTVLLDDDLDSFNLMICTKWLWDRETGMVVQEIGIPSGFQPELSSLDNVAGLKRAERLGNVIAVYFDKMTKTSVCYSVMMTRTAKVARSQKSFVRTFDYYSPGDQATVFYQPRKLRESTICDVCDGCCQ